MRLTGGTKRGYKDAPVTKGSILKLEVPSSPECDCRQVTVRRIRAAIVIVGLITAVVRAAAFTYGMTGFAVCSLVIAVAIAAYGVVTCFDESATFPKWLYAAVALAGVGLSVPWFLSLLA